MQYKKQLEKLGISEGELTPKIKSMISELNEAVNEREELENDLKEENYENDEEKDEMNVALVEIDELISTSDAEISEKIVSFAKGKQSRSSKSTQTQGAVTTTQVVKPNAPVVQANNEEKKSGGGGLFFGLLGVAALVLTFGSVNMFSGDD